MEKFEKFIWHSFYRPRIFEKVASGCFDTWAEISTPGSPRRKIVTKIYKSTYFLFRNQTLATFSKFCANKTTYSQHYQDLFVLYFQSSGVFIEIGASDGLTDNNTYLLEKLGWNGICFEANKSFWEELTKNRKCIIDSRAVYSESHRAVSFSIDHTATFSGIILPNQRTLRTHKVEIVKTISLNDIFELLNRTEVTYLSIDVEGAELEILSKFDFSTYKIKMITVEHNGDLRRAVAIHKLLVKNGYKRIFKYISGPDFFYISKKI